jgi:hypothetical protein
MNDRQILATVVGFMVGLRQQIVNGSTLVDMLFVGGLAARITAW